MGGKAGRGTAGRESGRTPAGERVGRRARAGGGSASSAQARVLVGFLTHRQTHLGMDRIIGCPGGGRDRQANDLHDYLLPARLLGALPHGACVATHPTGKD